MDFAEQAVENLVSQFSSALDFYRELVQNSIDAGSEAIDIWLDFSPDDTGVGGVIEIHVDDHGEGMNEAIIDGQLTTLFASTKDDDLTKIGKFGIGFVSVFALRPKGVLLQTGRDGEYWEVFFDHDRSFTKAPLATPIEGTQITLFIEGDRASYIDLVVRSRETLDHWCRHSEAEIHFEDRASQAGISEIINQPFAVDGECLSGFEREGTEIVLAYSNAPVWGFYNRGLALAVARGESDLVPSGFGHIAFRIKSRYLEHTLARETVMRDDNYHKAMAMVAEAAAGPLRRRLVASIVELVKAAAAGRRWTARERARYFELMGYLACEGTPGLAEFGDAAVLLSLDGRAWSLEQLAELAAADGRVYVEYEASSLVDGLLAQDTPVIMIPSAEEVAGELVGARRLGPVTRVIANYLAREFETTGMIARVIDKFRTGPELNPWVQASELIARPAEVLIAVDTVTGNAAADALIQRTAELLREALGGGPKGLARAWAFVRRRPPAFGFADLVGARFQEASGGDLGVRARLFVVAHEIAPLMAIPTAAMLLSGRRARPWAAINCEHVHFRALLRLAEAQPEIAAYGLAKALLLDRERGLEFDVDLIEVASQVER